MSAPVRPPLSRGRRLLFWAVLLAFLVAFAWVASIVARTTSGYLYVKKQPSGWRGQVARPDARLGVAPIPGAIGTEILPGGFEVPVRFDEMGFRMPLTARPSPPGGPTVLALGDSFTFGTGCVAEETYPFLVAQALHGRALVAGYPGYGLAQVLALAQEHLPRLRPDLLLVQASTWLPARSANRLRKTAFDFFPVPHFVSGKGGVPEWRPPLFLGKVFELPITRYRDTRKGLLDWGSFVTRVGFPLFLHDDPRRLALMVGERTGRLPRLVSRERISATVYPEILRLCRESGTRMVVVVLENDGEKKLVASDLGLPAEVSVIETVIGLTAGMASPDRETYLRAYGHWMGSPPRLVDEHPNARAHAIIAEQVLRALSE